MMRTVYISAVVEGHGEVHAFRELVRRVAKRLHPGLPVEVLRPLRVPRSRLIRAGELERRVDLAARLLGGRPGGVLVLLDSDDDCPAHLGPALLRRARTARSDVPCAVVLAHREFEAWFLAGAESLRGHIGLPKDLCAPANPETVRDAKQWLTRHMPAGQRYNPVAHQAVLVDKLDLDQALRAPSFAKLYREVERLVAEASRTLT